MSDIIINIIIAWFWVFVLGVALTAMSIAGPLFYHYWTIPVVCFLIIEKAIVITRLITKWLHKE